MNRRLLLLLAFAAVLISQSSFAHTTIKFAKGSDSGVWTGFIDHGFMAFSLVMSKGQRLWVKGDDINDWKAVSPAGQVLGCHGANHCSPNDDQGVLLPESGAYVVSTSFRMGGGVMTAPALRRYVRITFTVR
jgi:hypothetical protein